MESTRRHIILTGIIILALIAALLPALPQGAVYAAEEEDVTVEAASEETVAKPEKILFSQKSFTYNGEHQKPKVWVKDENGKTIDRAFYKVTFPDGSRRVGKHTVKVTFTGGGYEGSLTRKYTIRPKTSWVVKLTARKYGFTVKWHVREGVSGYQIQWAANSSFTKSRRTVTVKDSKAGSKVVKKRQGSQKYYVRVRTYKVVDGERIYGKWSKAKTVKTKGYYLYPKEAPEGYTGWITLRSEEKLYYEKNGEEVYKTVPAGDTFYFKNGKKLKSRWIDGKYVDKHGVLIGDKQASIKSFLKTAMKPMGHTSYIWGGGWPYTTSRRDITIGVSKTWREFYDSTSSNYDWRQHKFEIEKGLDCSGFVGWTIYNSVNTKSGGETYTTFAEVFGPNLKDKGLGTVRKAADVETYKPGDILYNPGHVWICLGTCSDGSVLLVHSSPGGVQINGTPTPSGKRNSKAVRLSREYMKKYRPEWKYDVPVKDYLGQYNRFRFTVGEDGLFTDEEGWRDKSGEEILKLLFGE